MTSFPPNRFPGASACISAILGIGGGGGLVLGAVIVEHLSWHWLFWAPLVVTLLAALATWRFIPGVAGALAGSRELAGGGADERSGSAAC